ncbi:protocadherin alpha-5-like [Passer montanus]|uniref:protocadherin alpha-5-like n=1 Tax=Passer montanus TaxID=9160 RepID=UPI00195F7BBC|nr:protocadherin alpha-5-like [Passer montanus]
MGERWCAAVLRVLVLQALAWALAGGQVRYSVAEEAKAGTVVGRLAQDLGLEAGEAEARRLRLVAPGRRASVEVSGASGALLVSSRLDREELCGKSAPCALRLEVLLERPLRVFHVQLEVTDINDNAPVFPAARKNLSIAELTTLPGSRFPLEGASDEDIGVNAQLSYTLSPSEHFRIEEESSNSRTKSLYLVLTKALDRETIPVHRLVLTASDGGRPSLTGTMELVISVLDANDNAPQFNQSVYNVHLSEDAIQGTLVAQMNATDLDEGSNRDVKYEIDTVVPPSGSDLFSIDANTGEIRLKGALDFEVVNLYDLNIRATDKGTPPLSGHCKVVLEVLDVNDNTPEVWVTSLSVPVAEDASVGTVVALLSVLDRDSGENGRVRCWVWPASPFGLEATFAGSYSLVLREALDRERVSEYEVEVRAEDGGAPALRASRGLRVPVSDVNDNAPAFAQAVYTVLARENNAAGAELARLWARDPDEAGNGRVSYSLWEGGGGGAAGSSSSWSGGGWRPASSYVSVDAESGRLWALQPLDYEELQVLQFEVRAVDAGEPPLSGNATVQLFVLDENDNAPALLPAAGSAPEAGAVAAETAAAGVGAGSGSGTLWAWAAWGAPAGQVVAKIRAVDADSGYNAWLRYELWAPRGKGLFRVGLYSCEGSECSLDRETIPVHRLVLTASDGGRPSLTGTMELVISVVDANDNAPQFNQSVYKVQLLESAAVGTLVTRVNATDADEGINSEVTYAVTNFIPPSGKDVISINPNFVARVNATDPDEGSNKQFSYNILSSTPIGNKELFTIDTKTGDIRLKGTLDFEGVSLHELQIEATDKGTPPLSGHCSVELKVLDVNDNAPEVWVTSLSVPVAEDASVGTVVALLSVSDRDSGENGRVRCWVWPAFLALSPLPRLPDSVCLEPSSALAVPGRSVFHGPLSCECWLYYPSSSVAVVLYIAAGF